jgi:hypothetical protein
MKYLVRSIHQMSAVEVQQYIDLFNKIFAKTLTTDEFYYKFSKQFGDNSHFAFMVDEQSGIVGSVGAIEVLYMWRGQRFTFGLTVDGMIEVKYRNDLLALKRLHDLLTMEISKRNICFIFTKPNRNSYLYLKRLLGLRDLGNLSVYAFPLRLAGAVSRHLRWLDAPWTLAINLFSPRHDRFREAPLEAIGELVDRMPPERQTYAHRVRDADFLWRRYGWHAYRYAMSNDKFVVYRILEFRNRYACFIMEATPLPAVKWVGFARYVVSRYPSVNVMLYVDSCRRHSSPFIRVPRWLLPDKLNIVGKVLESSTIPADITFSMQLSDFEVV